MVSIFREVDKKHDRSGEIAQLCNVIEEHNLSREIIYLYGEYHVGKTYMCEQLESELRNPRAVTIPIGEIIADYPIEYLIYDCKNSVGKSEFEIINELYKSIIHRESIHATFPRYEFARNKLYLDSNKTKESLRIDRWNNQVFENLMLFTNTLVKIGLSGAMKDLSASSAQAAQESADYFTKEILREYEKLKPKLNEFILERNVKQFYTDLAPYLDSENKKYTRHDLEEKLTELFVKDLNEYTNQNSTRCVIILDTYEVFSNRKDGDRNNWFYNKLISQTDKTLWIIFGNDPQAFSSNDVDIWEIDRFDEDTTKAFLNAEGIHSVDIIERFFSITKGLPGALRLLSEAYKRLNKQRGRKPSLDDFEANISESAIYCDVFEKIYAPQLRKKKEVYKILRYLACLSVWDRSIFDFISQKLNISYSSDLFQEVIEICIVRKKKDFNQYFIIDLAKKCLVSSVELSSDYIITDAYYHAFIYYSQKCNDYLRKWKKNNTWDKDAYQILRSSSENAVSYGCELIGVQEKYLEFCEWFIDKDNGDKGFEQLLTRVGLYALKRDLLLKYLNKDYSAPDPDNEARVDYRLQSEYDITWTYIYLLDYPLAISKILRRLDTGLKVQRSHHEINVKCIYTLGVIYHRMEYYEEAESWHTLALMLRRNSNDLLQQAISLNAIANIKLNQGNYEEAYQMLGESESIRNALLKTLHEQYAHESDIIQMKTGLIAVKTNLSKLFYLWALSQESKEYFLKAKQYANECIPLCKDVNSGSLSIIYAHLIRCEIVDFDLIRFFGTITKKDCEKLEKTLEDSIKIYKNEEKEGRSLQLFSSQVNYYIVSAFKGSIDQARSELSRLLEERENQNRNNGVAKDKHSEQIKRNLEVLYNNNIDFNKLSFIY